MSFTEVRPYIKARLKTVLPKSEEHFDISNTRDIPDTILNKTYHIEFNEGSFSSENQTVLKYNIPVTLRVWFKGYRKPSEAVDNALESGQAILQEMLKCSNRLTQPGIKNIVPNFFRTGAFSQKNDSIVELAIGLEFFILINID